MKKYFINIKNSSEHPEADYEDETLAPSRMKAARTFQRRLNRYGGDHWDISLVLENMES